MAKLYGTTGNADDTMRALEAEVAQDAAVDMRMRAITGALERAAMVLGASVERLRASNDRAEAARAPQ